LYLTTNKIKFVIIIFAIWYGSGNIQPATSNFIDIKQANKIKEMSLREIVSSLTRGRGFFLAVIVKAKIKQKNMLVLKVILVAIIHKLV
jgi:hypothetical protein